jgi:hypothetical protein
MLLFRYEIVNNIPCLSVLTDNHLVAGMNADRIVIGNTKQ